MEGFQYVAIVNNAAVDIWVHLLMYTFKCFVYICQTVSLYAITTVLYIVTTVLYIVIIMPYMIKTMLYSIVTSLLKNGHTFESLISLRNLS